MAHSSRRHSAAIICIFLLTFQGTRETEQKRPDGDSRIIVFLGKQVTLSCPSSDSNFNWTHWGVLAKSDERKVVVENGQLTKDYEGRFALNGSQLVIMSATWADTGVYECNTTDVGQTTLLKVTQSDCKFICKSAVGSMKICLDKCGLNPAMTWELDFAVVNDPKEGDGLHTSGATSCVWTAVVAVLVVVLFAILGAVCVLSNCFGYVTCRSRILKTILFWKKIVCRLCGSESEENEHLLEEQHAQPVNKRPSLRGMALIGRKSNVYVVFKGRRYVYIHKQADKVLEPWESKFRIELKDAVDLYDIVACPRQQYLYVSGRKDMCIWRIDVDRRDVEVWKSFEKGQPRFLSVDYQQMVYVTFSENLFGIYRATDGSEVRLVEIPTEFHQKNFTLQHMIPCTTRDENVYIATHFRDFPNAKIEDHQICQLTMSENDIGIANRFGREHGSEEDQMNGPFYVVACGEHGYAVADDENCRVILFNEDLTVSRIFQSNPPESRPRRLAYVNDLLFIGTYKHGIWTQRIPANRLSIPV